MRERPRLPRDLCIVAMVQLLMGVGAIVNAVVRSHFSLQTLGIPICFGLLWLRRGWRACALVVLGLDLLLVSVGLLCTVMNAEGHSFKVFGFDDVPRVWAIALGVGFLALSLWQFLVLERRDVVRLFFPDRGLSIQAQQSNGAPSGDGS